MNGKQSLCKKKQLQWCTFMRRDHKNTMIVYISNIHIDAFQESAGDNWIHTPRIYANTVISKCSLAKN